MTTTLTLQVLRGGQWRDFATGDASAAARHIEANVPGVWRAVNWNGQVVLAPRDVDVYLAANGHVMMPRLFLREDDAGLPVYAEPRHNPNCPCGRDS